MSERPRASAAVLAAIPDAAAQMAWIEQIVGFGVRRPGTPAGQAVAEWCALRLAEFGCAVESHPLTALTSHPGPAVVRAGGAEWHGLSMPFSTAGTWRGPLAELTFGESAARVAAGHAALARATFTELPVHLLDPAVLARHDPRGELATHVHTLPFGPALGKEVDRAVAAGAAALVGIVDAPWDTADYFVPYDGLVRPIQAAWFDRRAGAALRAQLAAGVTDVELVTDVVNRDTTDYNVVATLPGRGDGWVVVGSHHDAPWASAVEDASGIAQVLAQAAAWAAVPADARPHNLAFLLTAAHMSEGAGTRAFLRDWEHRDRIVFGLHLEHVAARAVPDGAGGLVSSGEPEVRWWFVSAGDEQAAWVAHTADAIARHDLDRSIVLPPDVFGPMPPTDGGFYHLAGIPMVNLLAAPMYLFDPADRPDMIHVESLVPTARAAADLVAVTSGSDPRCNGACRYMTGS